MSIEDEIKAEEDTVKKIKRLCRIIARHSPPISHWGDGNCGAIINYLEQALIQAGLFNAKDETAQQEKKILREPICGHVRKVVFERDTYRCCVCGDYHNLQIDHIKPVSKGGTNDLDNLQTLCQACNSKKSNRYE